MMESFKVEVCEGHVVYHGDDIVAPGESFEADAATARKLLNSEVVVLAELEEEKPGNDPLVAAIGGLDPDKSNGEFWTKSGKPQTSALEKRVGLMVSARDRDAAWKRYNDSLTGD